MSSDLGYLFGAALAVRDENKRQRNSKEEYDQYVKSKEKILEDEYNLALLYVNLFTTETANEDIYKVIAIAGVGVSIEDANFELMKQARDHICNTIVGVRYEYHENDFGIDVIATGTIATTDKEIYLDIEKRKLNEIKKLENMQEQKDQEIKEQELEKQKNFTETERELDDFLSNTDEEFSKIIKAYSHIGFKAAEPINSDVYLSLYLDEEKEITEKSLLGKETKVMTKILNRIDIIDLGESMELRWYKKLPSKDWKLDHEDVVEKNISNINNFIENIEL